MSTVIEKNDVEIGPLFSWSKEFVIESNGEEIPVYMRVVGDADVNKSRVSALRRSAELRKKLRDSDSDEHFAYIKPMEDLSIESLVSVILVFSMREFSEQAKKEVKIKLPKQPKSDAKTEEHEKYQKEVDEYPEKYQKELKKLLEKKVDAEKDRLSGLGKEVLYTKYTDVMIEELCERELLKAFREWTAYLSAYKDKELTQKFFTSFEEFNNLPSELKEQFIKEYSLLELTMDNLKKLRPVTQ